MKFAIDTLTEYVIPKTTNPTAPVASAMPEIVAEHEFYLDIYKEDVRSYCKRRDIYNDNKTKIYSLFLGKCSEPMKARVRGNYKFDNFKDGKDMIYLFKLISYVS